MPTAVAVWVAMLYSMIVLFARLAMKRLPWPSETMPSGPPFAIVAPSV